VKKTRRPVEAPAVSR